MSLPLVLVTGATGYVGGHIAVHAVEAGYPVRIVVRPAKLHAAKEQFGDRVEIFVIDDLATADFTDALRGVGALIHAAQPIIGRVSAEDMMRAGIEGSMNIIHQAEAAGVKRIVHTSSWAAVHESLNGFDLVFTDHVYDEKEWNPMTEKNIVENASNPVQTYCGTKAVTEREVWRFADENPHVDVTTICPPFIYGPLIPGTKLTRDALLNFSTIGEIFYTQVFKQPNGGDRPEPHSYALPLTVDVRDCARAHILALSAPTSRESGVGRKRIVLGGPNFTFRQAVEYLHNAHPEIIATGRIWKEGNVLSPPTISTIDNSRAEEVLGFKAFVPWQKTVEDTTNSLLELEKTW